MSVSEKNVVSISFDELNNFHRGAGIDASLMRDLLEKIGYAFGDSDSSLGIIAISNIPNFSEFRSRLLPLSRKLALLPSQELDQIIVESAGYQVGWSHGKERVEGEGKYDNKKGSFYANPLTDDLLNSITKRDFTEDTREHLKSAVTICSLDELETVASRNPAFFAPNVWPTDSIPEGQISLLRENAQTSYPRSNNATQVARPTNPDEPVTKTRMT